MPVARARVRSERVDDENTNPATVGELCKPSAAAMLLVGSQISVVLGAGPYSGIRDTGCAHHGGSGYSEGIFLAQGTYINYYYWNDPDLN